MKNSLKIKCPAKINLTLEIVNKREDGFHNIKSIMQTISLYDYLTIQTSESTTSKIILNGNSNEIPYDETNLVYKAAKLYVETANIKNRQIEIFIEKNIPIAAGLAGGSTDAAGTIFGLNKIFGEPLTYKELHDLCASLGSDLNVCLEGGCILATSRGEVIQNLPVVKNDITLIKPKNLGISAKEAYTKYSLKELKPQNNNTEKMQKAILENKNINKFLYNDLEYAIFNDYSELQKIKRNYPNSIMSGSGSTYFVLENIKKSALDENYLVIDNLHFVTSGVEIVSA